MKTKKEWLNELKGRLRALEFGPLSEILSNTYADLDDLRDGIDYLDDEVTEYIDENSDITYYSSAMEFLTTNDISLKDSLELAGEMSYKPEDLNSEILASLLNKSYTQQEWEEVKYKANEIIEEFFEENGDEIDAEEEENEEDAIEEDEEEETED